MSPLDGAVAILWGSVARELNWVHLSPKHGRTSVARASEGGFWVRETHEVPTIEAIADEAYEAWLHIRSGKDVSDWATHRLVPPSMQDIGPMDE